MSLTRSQIDLRLRQVYLEGAPWWTEPNIMEQKHALANALRVELSTFTQREARLAEADEYTNHIEVVCALTKETPPDRRRLRPGHRAMTGWWMSARVSYFMPVVELRWHTISSTTTGTVEEHGDLIDEPDKLVVVQAGSLGVKLQEIVAAHVHEVIPSSITEQPASSDLPRRATFLSDTVRHYLFPAAWFAD